MNHPAFAILAIASTLAAGGETVAAIPEPCTYLMMATGVFALAFAHFRRSKKK